MFLGGKTAKYFVCRVLNEIAFVAAVAVLSGYSFVAKSSSPKTATMKRLTSRQLSKLSTVQKLTPLQRRKESAMQP
jgi:hypothetical protein